MIVGQLKYVYFWLKSCQNAFDIIKPRSVIEIRCGSRQTPRLLPREISFFSYLHRQKKCRGKLESIFLDFVQQSNVLC